MEKLLILKETKKMIDCSKTENYMHEKARMTKSVVNGVCHIRCTDCPLSRFNNNEKIVCSELELFHSETAVQIVQRWSDEHPQRTYLSEFLKNYPNAPLEDDGAPEICLSSLGLTNYNGCKNGITCLECWNEPIEDSEKQ
jgi:hypothetical protein